MTIPETNETTLIAPNTYQLKNPVILDSGEDVRFVVRSRPAYSDAVKSSYNVYPCTHSGTILGPGLCHRPGPFSGPNWLYNLDGYLAPLPYPSDLNQAFADLGRMVFSRATETISCLGGDEESEAVMEDALKLGLVQRPPYDPKIHGDMDCEPGEDLIWWWGHLPDWRKVKNPTEMKRTLEEFKPITPDFTSVCDLITIHGDTLPEALHRTADYLEQNPGIADSAAHGGFQVSAAEDDGDVYRVTFTGHYDAGTTLAAIRGK